MARQDLNIQDGYLFQGLKESRPLEVVLTSGKQYQAAKLRRFSAKIASGFNLWELPSSGLRSREA